jgi:hypothetical protein
VEVGAPNREALTLFDVPDQPLIGLPGDDVTGERSGHWWAAYPRPASRNGTASKGYHERPATVSPKRLASTKTVA